MGNPICSICGMTYEKLTTVTTTDAAASLLTLRVCPCCDEDNTIYEYGRTVLADTPRNNEHRRD